MSKSRRNQNTAYHDLQKMIGVLKGKLTDANQEILRMHGVVRKVRAETETGLQQSRQLFDGMLAMCTLYYGADAPMHGKGAKMLVIPEPKIDEIKVEYDLLANVDHEKGRIEILLRPRKQEGVQ